MSTFFRHIYTIYSSFIAVVLLLVITSNQPIYAQQDAQFTHYSFNTLNVNPAYAGSRDVLTITGLHRSQWIGFPDAPITQTLTVHGPLKENLGIGLSLVNDKAGPAKNTGLLIDFSYKIKLTKKSSLSFGLKGGVDAVSTNLVELKILETNDPHFDQNLQYKMRPNFGLGLYYRLPNFYAGLSVPRILNTSSLLNTVISNQRHYYVIAGSFFDLNSSSSLKLKPTALIRITKGAPVQLDLTALFYFKDLVWAGPMFRTTDAFGVLAGIQLSDQFSFGYSFDWSFGNNTGRYNGGSHEIMLRFDFFFNNKLKIESPRYF